MMSRKALLYPALNKSSPSITIVTAFLTNAAAFRDSAIFRSFR
jgi:hypothetical protein